MIIGQLILFGVSWFIAFVWSAIGLLIRRYPEVIAGYNSMPQEKRDRINIVAIGRLLSNVMFVGGVSIVLAPFVSTKFYPVLICVIPMVLIVAGIIYVNVRKKKFEK